MTKFNSHIKSLKIVLKPAMPIFEGGQKVADALGKYAQFSDGQFQTEDKEIIERLEKLPTFGVDFWKVDEAEQNESSKVDGDSETNLEKLTKKELQSLATEKGIEFDGTETKDRLIELLQEPEVNE